MNEIVGVDGYNAVITGDNVMTISAARAGAQHVPLVLMSCGFCTDHSATSRGVGYAEEVAPSLRSAVVPAVEIVYGTN